MRVTTTATLLMMKDRVWEFLRILIRVRHGTLTSFQTHVREFTSHLVASPKIPCQPTKLRRPLSS